MRTSSLQLDRLILDQLAHGEMRLLVLVVAVRKAMSISRYKGDLAVAVRNALRKLICAKAVVDDDGVYSLAPSRHTKPLASASLVRSTH